MQFEGVMVWRTAATNQVFYRSKASTFLRLACLKIYVHIYRILWDWLKRITKKSIDSNSIIKQQQNKNN